MTSYKQCKTAQELNEYTQNERLTRCGYIGKHWTGSVNNYHTSSNLSTLFQSTRKVVFNEEKQ